MDISNLPPDVIAALFGMGSAQEQEDETQAAIRRSQELQQEGSLAAQHTTGIGAALGGIADMIKARRGATAVAKGKEQLKKDRYGRDLAETRALYRLFPPAPTPAGGDPADPVLANQPLGYVKPFGF